MIKRKNGKKKGFSLIELIIVLAVMAIIALIAIPNFTAVKKNSANKADEQSCQVIDRAVLMLVSDGTVKTTGKVTFTAPVSEGADGTWTNGVTSGITDAAEKAAINEALLEVKIPQGNKILTEKKDKEGEYEYTEGSPKKYQIQINSDGTVEVSTIE